MKIRKIAVTLLIFCMTVVCTGFAQEVDMPSADFNEVTGTVTITGNHPAGEGAQVTVSVSMEGETQPHYWYGTDSEDNGSFAFIFEMDRQLDDNGIYKVLIGGAGLSAVETEYSFYVPEDEESILSNINATDDYSVVQNIIETKGTSFGIDYEDEVFTMISDDGKTAVYQSLLRRDFASTAETKREFYRSCAVQGLNEASTADGEDALKQYAKYLDIDMGRNSYFAKIRSEECKDMVIDKFAGNNLALKNGADISEEFQKACALAIINDADTSNRSALIGMIEEFNENGYSDISLTEYTKAKFDELEQLNVASLVIEEKNKSYFASFDEVEIALSKACKTTLNSREVEEDDDDNRKGSGGGRISASISVSNDIVESVQSSKDTNLINKFIDLDVNHWAHASIMKLAAKNIVSGTGENLFEPDRSINREEFVKILVDAFSVENSYMMDEFEDVNTDEWYYPYIKSAFAKGIVNGVGENIFGVGRNISREDLATMVYRTMLVMNIKTEEVNTEIKFSDLDEISDYAVEAVEYLAKSGIINGISETEFAPKATATRAMAAKIVLEVMERGGLN